MPRRALRRELPSISNEMRCACCGGKATLRKEDFMEKKARLDGILMGEEERRKRFYRRALPENRTLKEALGCLSREELDDLAYNLCLEGTEGMTLPALIDTLLPAAVQFAERWLPSAFEEQYQAFRHIQEKGGLANDFREDDVRIDYLCGLGIMAVGADEGKLYWYMPEEMAEIFKKLDSAVYEDAVRLNTEIMRLATGLLFYYGFLDYDQLFAMVNAYLEESQRLDFAAFMGVMLNGSCWHKEVIGTERGLAYHTLLSAPWLEREQKEKENLPFAEIPYGKVYDAGEEGYIEATLAYKKLAQFFMAKLSMEVLQAAEAVGKILLLFQNGGSMKDVAAFLETLGKLDDEAAEEEMTKLVIALHATTRLWRLKGHTPGELKENAREMARKMH